MIFWKALSLLGGIPWKNILLFAAIAGASFGAVLYIRAAEENRAAIEALKVENSGLRNANDAMRLEFENQFRALEAALREERERERDYAESIESVRAAPDGACARNSAPIVRALRLRRERETSRNPG